MIKQPMSWRFTRGDLDKNRSIPGMCDSIWCHQSYDFPHIHKKKTGEIIKLEDGDFIVKDPDLKQYYHINNKQALENFERLWL